MRLHITGLLIIGTFRIGICQTNRTVTQDSCEKAIELADNNAKSGILKTFHWGLPTDFEYNKFYDNYWATKLGIESVDKGCIIQTSDECYDKQMRKIIQDKFGADFFPKTEQQIRSEYEVFKTLDSDQRKRYIDLDFTYKVVDHKADYIEGHKNLIKELHKRIDFSKLDFKGRTIFLSLVIGQTGTVDKCEVISKGTSRLDTEKIENTIKGLRWTPARLYGYDVKSEKIIGIPTTVE